jgi:glycosyltransferase involved in cell wall biosynthesis
MIILMKGLQEEKIVQRCLSDFHDESFVDQIIVIDGGSTDYTVQELKKFEKVSVYVHPWLQWYHDMETCQSNIALSYVPIGKTLFILDFDERMSPELKTFLDTFKEGSLSVGVALAFSRKTVDVFRYDNSPHAIIGEDGWPIISHQIGQYPDYQCRMFVRSPEMRWINSPHHQLIGQKMESSINADIVHYEKDDLRDRISIERKWLRMANRRKELGLTPDVFECRTKPEVAQYLEEKVG